jgi:probable HAF family extracellular repeat protein
LGGGTSKGYGINADGRVTGEAVTAGGALHAFLYAKRAMRDLNSMIDPVIAAQLIVEDNHAHPSTSRYSGRFGGRPAVLHQ